jgi:Flp pilus assembly pilin Flp
MKEELMTLFQTIFREKELIKDETGAATAEYAIATMAAVGFAGLLVIIMRSDEVKDILLELVRSALTFSSDEPSA